MTKTQMETATLTELRYRTAPPGIIQMTTPALVAAVKKMTHTQTTQMETAIQMVMSKMLAQTQMTQTHILKTSLSLKKSLKNEWRQDGN